MRDVEIKSLLDVMEKLRDPEQGCVWDRAQTFQSIVPYTIEEVYEVVNAIETGEYEELKDELGDLLFQIVFYSQIAREQGHFSFSDVVNAITEKMIRRHPHVFSDHKVESVEEQSDLWEQIKREERQSKSKDTDQTMGHLDNIIQNMPGLIVAKKLQKQAAKVGFDWDTLDGPLNKVREETDEVIDAIDAKDQAAIQDEIGDLLFACVNLSRHLNVDPEAALRSTNRKFTSRFQAMESLCDAQNIKFESLSLEEMEELWVKVKQSS